MNTKELIAAEIAKVVPELEQENIQSLLETCLLYTSPSPRDS